MKKILVVVLLFLFGAGVHMSSATTAVAVVNAEHDYSVANAQVFIPSERSEAPPQASRPEIEVVTLDVVRPPVDNAVISSGYGWRTAACRGCSSNHQGIDYTPGRGAPIYVVAAGTVVDSGWMGGYGYAILVRHVINGQTVETLYAHMLSASPYGAGAELRMGDIIGAVGSTGTSTGAHLHFEVRINGTPINPAPWLARNVNYQDWNHLL